MAKAKQKKAKVVVKNEIEIDRYKIAIESGRFVIYHKYYATSFAEPLWEKVAEFKHGMDAIRYLAHYDC